MSDIAARIRRRLSARRYKCPLCGIEYGLLAAFRADNFAMAKFDAEDRLQRTSGRWMTCRSCGSITGFDGHGVPISEEWLEHWQSAVSEKLISNRPAT
jgi:hypothetical protein